MSNIFVKMGNGIENALGFAPRIQQPSSPLPGSPSFTNSIPAIDSKNQFSPRPVPSAWQPAINSAYQQYPTLPKGIVESVLMKESSMGTNSASYNKINGESAWLGGLTQGAANELQKRGTSTNFNTQEGAINGVASYLAYRQNGILNNGKTYKITDPSNLYFNRYKGSPSSSNERKVFAQYLNYYSKNQPIQ